MRRGGAPKSDDFLGIFNKANAILKAKNYAEPSAVRSWQYPALHEQYRKAWKTVAQLLGMMNKEMNPKYHADFNKISTWAKEHPAIAERIYPEYSPSGQ